MSSDTSAIAVAPAGDPGVVDVVFWNPDGQHSTLSAAYTYALAPSITSLSPVAGPITGGTPITITGTEFGAETSVTIAGTDASDVIIVSPTSITATTPPGAPGAADVVVNNADSQTGSLVGGFTYLPPPTVTSLSPNTGLITGRDDGDDHWHWLRSRGVGEIRRSSSHGGSRSSPPPRSPLRPLPELRVRPEIVVTNADAQIGTLLGGFTFAPPSAVWSVVPNLGPITGGTVLTISGVDFLDGATVTFGGAAATSVVLISPTSPDRNDAGGCGRSNGCGHHQSERPDYHSLRRICVRGRLRR